ncbi:uncharacterized protein LOC134442846 [Engraulis encrasicolus]|uniref:uncharacterized protein LOC134442846 n=1 Tax=Engraulis encrasicolus TaxID=184585 RepID=UPI002FCEC822
MAKDAQMSGSRPSTPSSVTLPSELAPKRSGREIFQKLKSALGSLRKSVTPQPTHSADTPAQCPMAVEHGSESHDLICMAKTLERLLSSDSIDNIAKGLVDQIQAVRQDRTPTPTALDGKSTPGSESQMTAPQKTLSATQVVYSFTEHAIKGLLQSHLLPLVEWNAGRDVATPGSTVSEVLSPPARDSADELRLGLDKPDCSCLVAKLLQALPSIPHQQTVESTTLERSSSSATEVANVFSQLMTSQVIDMIDSEMAKHLEQKNKLTLDETRILSTTPDKDESVLGKHLASVPDSQGALISRLLKRFLSQFKSTDSGVLSAVDSASASASTSEKTQSASAKLEDVLGLFTSVMVHKVLEILDADLEMRQDGVLDLTQSALSIRLSSVAPSIPLSDSTIPDIYKYVTARDKQFICAACKRPGDTNDNGCLVTALVLRLLTKMQDQQTGPADAKTDAQKLLERLLLEFTNASGTLDFSAYENNIKLQSIYRALNTFLLKNFGSQAILQKPADAEDTAFDDLLMSALTKELLRRCDVEVTAIPSASGGTPSASGGTPSAPGVPPTPEPQAAGTGSKTHKTWFSFKILKRRSKNRVSPSGAIPPDTNQSNSADAAVPVQKPRKRLLFIKLFTSCFKGSEES